MLLLLAFSAAGASSSAPECSAVFKPGEIWFDNHGAPINAHSAGILVHQGTYYWFGEHKNEGGDGLARVGVHCYSSKNLADWTDEGIALRVSDDPTNDIAKGCIIERPKVLYNAATRKFVMWFHLERASYAHAYLDARCGVAVSDAPTGPFRFVKSFRPDAKAWPENTADELKKPLSPDEAAALAKLHLTGGPVPNYPQNTIFRRDFDGGQMSRDMTLFADDDGSAYLISSSEDNGTLHISQLTDDYLGTRGRYIRLFPGDFNESPALFKRRGKYYLISSNCNGWLPTDARSAVADNIWGPWTKLGTPCRGPAAETKVTFHSQSTFVLPVAGIPDAFIFMADRWNPQNLSDSRYIWLPVEWDNEKPILRWRASWSLMSIPPSDGSGR